MLLHKHIRTSHLFHTIRSSAMPEKRVQLLVNNGIYTHVYGRKLPLRYNERQWAGAIPTTIKAPVQQQLTTRHAYTEWSTSHIEYFSPPYALSSKPRTKSIDNSCKNHNHTFVFAPLKSLCVNFCRNRINLYWIMMVEVIQMPGSITSPIVTEVNWWTKPISMTLNRRQYK